MCSLHVCSSHIQKRFGAAVGYKGLQIYGFDEVQRVGGNVIILIMKVEKAFS